MREKFLRKLAYWHAKHPWRMVAFAALLTVVFGIFASNLSVTMRWSDILPSGDIRTTQYNKIIEEFVSATSIIIIVQGEEQQIKRYADDLAPRLLEAVDADLNKNLIQRVDYKAEIDFLKNHGLMLIKEDDLKNMKDLFKDPNLNGLLYNLNNSLEKEYGGREESISTREEEDQAVMLLDSIQDLLIKLEMAAAGIDVDDNDVHETADKLLFGEPYFLSYDKKALVLNAIPNFTMTDLDVLIPGVETIQGIVDDLLKEYPDVDAGLTGMIPVAHDEMVYSEKSLGYTSLIAVAAILILLILSLRMWVAPLFAMANLLIGILWATGAAAIVVGQLNIMTQMMAVILLGLGIDFSIHLISGFTERRAADCDILTSLEETFLKSGKGVITGGLTTAFAFLTLIISRSRGMKEMGIVTGIGLLMILLATFIILPVFLVFRERRMKKTSIRRDISFRFLGRTSHILGKYWPVTLLGACVITVLMIWAAANVTFDQNYMNIEPKGLISIELQDVAIDKFDLSLDYALVLADSPEESRKFGKAYRELSTVAMTEDISLYLPSEEEQAKRKPHIQEIIQTMSSAPLSPSITRKNLNEIVEQIKRLEDNILEIQDLAYMSGRDKVDKKCEDLVGNPEQSGAPTLFTRLIGTLTENSGHVLKGLSEFQAAFSPYYKESVLTMGKTDPLILDELPDSVLDRYSNTSRSRFLVTVFPSGNVFQNAEFLYRFTDDLAEVSERATGMPPVFRALIDIIGKDGRNAVLLTIIIVFLLLWFDFRKPQLSLMAMIPLGLGILWMVGLMFLTGMQFTVMNVMGLPMIVGIGIDDGVHIVHRWRSEGKGKLNLVFSSTGKAILLTSLTTMLAFGSLVFSIWRGFGQLGGALFLGVGACFLTTVLILSGIIGLVERKHLEGKK